MSIVTSFRIVQDWKKPHLPKNPLGKWVKKMIYSYNGALLSNKKNELLITYNMDQPQNHVE